MPALNTSASVTHTPVQVRDSFSDTMRLAMKDAQVQREHRQHEHIETDPEPDWFSHGVVNCSS